MRSVLAILVLTCSLVSGASAGILKASYASVKYACTTSVAREAKHVAKAAYTGAAVATYPVRHPVKSAHAVQKAIL